MKKPGLVVSILFFIMSLCAIPRAEAKSSISPEAEKIVGQLCDHLKSQAQFSYSADVVYSDAGENAEKGKGAFKGKMFVRRPDRLRVDAEGAAVNKDFLYDGKTITLHDKIEKVYGVLEAPADIEGALNKAHTDFNLRVALADLASPALGNLLEKSVHTSRYLGKQKVRGILCHRLEVSREGVRVQLWVDAGKDPILHKIAIVRKEDSRKVTWSADLSNWDFTSEIKDDVFSFVVPQGVEKINFVPAQKLNDSVAEETTLEKGEK